MQLRMEEKRIVSGSMDAVRARLAPIRGIPTKQGNLQDPNSVSLAGTARPVLLLLTFKLSATNAWACSGCRAEFQTLIVRIVKIGTWILEQEAVQCGPGSSVPEQQI